MRGLRGNGLNAGPRAVERFVRVVWSHLPFHGGNSGGSKDGGVVGERS